MEETGSQPIPPQLTGNIGEQATPTDPGNTQKRTQNHIVSVEYASHMMVPSASRNEISLTISKSYEWNNQGSKQKMDAIQESNTQCQAHISDQRREFYRLSQH